MNRERVMGVAIASGLTPLLPHPERRNYLHVRRESCGCEFERNTQGYRLENAGRCCPICGSTAPSPPVSAPILLVPPEEREYLKLASTSAALAYQMRDLRDTVDSLENTVNILIEGFKALIETNNLKMPE